MAGDVYRLFLADDRGHRIGNKRFTYFAWLHFMEKLSPCTVGIAAGEGAHNCARRLMKTGHTARLITRERVRSFVGRRN